MELATNSEESYELKFLCSEFTFDTTIISQLNLPPNVKEIIINLKYITFFDPFGIIFLDFFIKNLFKNYKVKVLLNNEVINYLLRMNLCDSLKKYNNLIIEPDIFNISIYKRNLREYLLELSEFEVNNDDEVNSVLERIIQITSPKIDFYNQIQDYFKEVIAELLSNIQCHSETNKSKMVIQSYSKLGNCIKIAIGDYGIGIKKSLEKIDYYLEDSEAILKAIEQGVSSLNYGGYGLPNIKDIILENNDKLCIRSGSGYYLLENKNERIGKCHYIPGTQILLSLTI